MQICKEKQLHIQNSIIADRLRFPCLLGSFSARVCLPGSVGQDAVHSVWHNAAPLLTAA